MDAIERLRSQGKIRYFGVSYQRPPACQRIGACQLGVVDSVQVIYNIFDQSPEDELFAAVEAERVGVIVRVPLTRGP